MDMVKSSATHDSGTKLPLILSISVALALVGCYFILPGFGESIDGAFDVLTSKDEVRIKEWVSQFGIWGPIVIIIAFVAQMFLFIVPNILLIIISVLSYGPVWGGLLAWTGILVASTVGYYIGNRLSPITVQRLVSDKTQKTLRDFIKNYGMKAIIALRLSSFSNDGLSLVAGLLNMMYRRFILATIIGITPLIATLAIFGRRAEIEKILPWVGGVLVLALVVYIIIDRRKGKQKK
jgi:uncharacterized membrane protein YdjX (TVP38/TMEM64 family)